MRRIGILAGCLGRRDGGPETYERELIRGIGRIDAENRYTIYSFVEGAREALGPLPANMRLRVLRPGSRWLSLTVSLPLAMLRDRIELLHACLYPPPVSPAPVVFTMHDISPLTRPDFFEPRVYRRLNPLVRRGLARARQVICVSHDAAKGTMALTGLDHDRVSVVAHGVEPAFHPAPHAADRTTLEADLGLAAPYLLYVGKIMTRKNVVRLIDAYARFVAETGSGVELVLAGKRLYDTSAVDAAIARVGPGGRVRELGHVPQALLPALYAHAVAFVYPTLWEGFGLPVLEAMASGTPVITSTVSSLPEIAGDAAILVDPEDTSAIAAAMVRLHADPALHAALAAQGIARARQFTWTETARATVAVYHQALSQGRQPGRAAPSSMSVPATGILR